VRVAEARRVVRDLERIVARSVDDLRDGVAELRREDEDREVVARGIGVPVRALVGAAASQQAVDDPRGPAGGVSPEDVRLEFVRAVDRLGRAVDGDAIAVRLELLADPERRDAELA
jgi:hypothetical protein